MTVYLNPPDRVRVIGRRLLVNQDYGEAMKLLRPDEHLYALCQDAGKSYAACVDKKEEFDRLFRLLDVGGLLTFELYAVSEDWHSTAR